MKRFLLALSCIIAFGGTIQSMSQEKAEWDAFKRAQLATKAVADGKQDEALRMFMEIANSKDPHFQKYVPMMEYNIGLVYYERNDFDSAICWFRKGAMRFNPNAQHNLAVALRDKNKNRPDSDEKERDITEAKVWLECGMLQGDATACNTLGIMYAQKAEAALTQAGRKQSLLEAIPYFKKAIELKSSTNTKILSSASNMVVFEQVEDDDHASVDAYNNLGVIYHALSALESDPWLEEQLIDKALEAYEQALNRKSKSAARQIQILRPIKERLRESRMRRNVSAHN